MSNSFSQNFKIGILDGGQLGRMLIQSGIDYNLSFSILDPDEQAPCKELADFHVGKITDFDTVMKFGNACDIITIEIEHVNTHALKELVKRGKKVFPQPEIIEMIQIHNSRLNTVIHVMRPTASAARTASPHRTLPAGSASQEEVAVCVASKKPVCNACRPC